MHLLEWQSSRKTDKAGAQHVNGEANRGIICNQTVQHDLYYLPVPMSGFDLSTLMDIGVVHSFIVL